MLLIILFALSLMVSAITIRTGISLSHSFGIVDHPSEHKQHTASTPFVGGLGIFFALIVALRITDYFQLSSDIRYMWMELAALAIFVTGFADDIWRLDYKVRFLVQAVVASVMALWGGVVLLDLGSLLSSRPFELGMLALPFTVFATIGVINALNMIDGIDGLSGSLSLVSLLLIAIAAFVAGRETYLALIVVLMGGVTGFLYYNLRRGSRRRAAVFLGDNGSMLLGFLFSWVLIDLTQGEDRAMTPVTALWIMAIPLMDAVGVMIRRLYYRHSPFHPDRNHLHHLFMRAGFRTQDIVYVISVIQLAFGSVGFVGLYLDVPEPWMLAGFIGVFMAYCYLIVRPWRFVPSLRRLHTQLELTSADCRGVFIGNYPPRDAQRFIRMLVEGLGPRDDYELCVYESRQEDRGERFLYAAIKLFMEEDEISVSGIRHLVDTFKKQFAGYPAVQVRQFINRNSQNDRRVHDKPIVEDFRNADRRSKHGKTLIYKSHGDDAWVGDLLKLYKNKLRISTR